MYIDSARKLIWRSESDDALFDLHFHIRHVNDVLRAALDSEVPWAAMGCRQDRINRPDGIKPCNRHSRTMASRAVTAHMSAWFGRDEGPPASGVSPILTEARRRRAQKLQ
jgi:hypothetical protein